MEWNNESKKGGGVMAVTRVIASVGNENGEMSNVENALYSGNVRAPDESGIYAAKVTAYDDAGNITVATGRSVEVTIWREPKVNWKPTDRFNYWDYNRIKNNLQWLHEKAVQLYKHFDIVDMGDDIVDFKSYWQVIFFNAWEENLEIINKNILIRNYGVKKTFYENGQFIKWDELNRIENATLEMRNILDGQEAALERLSFRFGYFKGVKI